MIQKIKTSELSPNNGQIEGLPTNPRLINEEKFQKLKKSLRDDPEMLELRELLVFRWGEEYVIIGGNMRFRAAVDLGIEVLPCKIIPPETSIEKLKAYVMKDNIAYGEYDWDLVANEWDAEDLEDWGLDVCQDDIEDCSILNDLENNAFINEVNNASDTFSVTFSFKKEYKEIVENYLKKMGKELLTSLIISNICQDVEAK